MDCNETGDEKNEGETSDGGAVVCIISPESDRRYDPRLVDVVLSKESENVREALERVTGRMGKAQAFEELTEVHDGLTLIMQAVKRGSVPTVEAVFAAMMSSLDDDQLTRAFAGGIPSRNLPLLFLAAKRGDRDVFDTVLGVLHRVAKVAHKNGKMPLDANEHSGGRGVLLNLRGKNKDQPGDLTLLQVIYSGNRSAVQTWIQRPGKSKQRGAELQRFHAGRMAVMHAALVGPPGMVSDLFGVMREVCTPFENIEADLENRASKASLLLSAAEGGNDLVFKEIMEYESWERLLDLFLGGYEYGRATLLDAALNEGPTSFRAVAEILDKELDKEEAIIMLENSSFDGSGDDDLRAYGVPERLAVAARVAALSHVLSSDQMADIATICLEAELDGMDKSLLPRDNRKDNWSGRLSFLLACGARVSSGAKGNLDKIFYSLGFDHLKKCIKQAISVVDNPFIPGMMLALSLAMKAPNVKVNERRKMNKLRKMVEELLLEVLERLPKTVQGLPGGATTCSVLFEPETTGTRSESFKGPLTTAFMRYQLVMTFCTQPLIFNFISHTFCAGLLNLSGRMPSDRLTPAVAAGVLKKIDPAVIAKGLLEKRLQQNRATLYPGAQFILVGIVTMPFMYYRVPLLRMFLDFAVYLILLFVYTYVVTNMYDTTIANGPEIALGFYVIAAVITEASAVGRSNREYFRDTWNFLDVPALFGLSTGFLIRLWNASDSDDSEQVGKALHLLAAPLLFSRILFFFRTPHSQGVLIQVMIRMVDKVVPLAIVLITIISLLVSIIYLSASISEAMWIAIKVMVVAGVEDSPPDPYWVDSLVFIRPTKMVVVFVLFPVIAVMLRYLSIVDLTIVIPLLPETENRAAKICTMDHYRRVVVNDVLPAPLNLFQLLALFPILIIDLCGNRGLYDRLKPTIARIVGGFVFSVTSGPVAIILGSLLWYISTPRAVINQWDQNKKLWDNVSRSVAIVLEHFIVVPLALAWLWVMNFSKGIRSSMIPLVSFSSDTIQAQRTIREILLRTRGGLGIHQPPPEVSSPYVNVASSADCSKHGLQSPSSMETVGQNVPSLLSTLCVTRHELVREHFGPTPAVFSLTDADVRLKVGHGCLKEGEAIGPITVVMDQLYLIECNDECFLASVFVECQPSGITLVVPLELEFRVGGPLDEYDDSDCDPTTLDTEQREEYKEILRKTYEVLWRDKEEDMWTLAEQDTISVVYDDGIFFVRASVNHFSQWCLARSINLESAYEDQVVTWPWRPGKKELEFVNATDRTLTFLVLPTTWSNKAVVAIATGLTVEKVGAHLAIDKAVEQSILEEATHPQVFQVPSTKKERPIQAGQMCPSSSCRLSNSTGNQARVALITMDDSSVAVWNYRIVHHRTRVVILPGQFSDGMFPTLGRHKLANLEQDSVCFMDIALTAMAKSLQRNNGASTVSTVSSSPDARLEVNVLDSEAEVEPDNDS